MRNKHTVVDALDERLTTGERNQIRQILFRLHGGKMPQPEIGEIPRRRYENGSLEEELVRVFGEAKSRTRD